MTDGVLVVDIEATCWQRNRVPPGEQNEIIEIGWCMLNRKPLEVGAPHTMLLKPQRSHISPFCTRLTSITAEMAAQGILFNEACTVLRRDFAFQDLLWVSWGDYDLMMFRRQCEQFQVTYPFSERHINLRQRYAELNPSTTGKVRQVGLMKALAAQGMTFEGRKHRGVDDAWNTARLLQTMIAKHGTGILDS